MPFLRRRGVMASDNDIRRHTIFDSRQAQNPPRKSLGADSLLSPESATNASTPLHDQNGGASRRENENGDALSRSSTSGGSRPSYGDRDHIARPQSPPVQEETSKHRRFSMLRFRNASDSQLSTRLRQQQQQQQQQQQEELPPVPHPPPNIITTAPTMDSATSSNSKKQARVRLPVRIRRSGEAPRNGTGQNAEQEALSKKDKRKTVMDSSVQEEDPPRQTVTFDDSSQPTSTNSPSASSEGPNSTLAPPPPRMSESSRSDASFGPSSSSTPQSRTSSTFFRMSRRKQKQPEPLFPISHLQRGHAMTPGATASSSSLAPPSLMQPAAGGLPVQSGRSNGRSTPDSLRPSTEHGRSTPLASPSHGNGLFGRSTGSPATALFRPGSRNSGQSSPTRVHHLALRGRSSTMSSLGRASVEDRQPGDTTRTSSSTGRKSFGDLLGINRLRQNPEGIRQGNLTPATPGSSTSKNNSLQLAREPIVLPDKREDDTPAKYLARLEETFSRGVIAAALSKGSDPFSSAVLRSYMRTFSFFEEPMDMAIRKLLMEAELPKETQQIDRCLQAFANRYHECNPGIYSSPDQAYFIAFSLLILHTDVFNKNNRFKMQKADYLKNTHGEGIFDDILECFYDNITYTPFIRVEDDAGILGEQIPSSKSKKKSILPNSTPDSLKKTKGPLDPYTLIIDGKLDTLRPPIKDQVPLDDHFSYLGTARTLDLNKLRMTFFRTGVLQIVSARSRPDAFMSEKTATNPQEAHPGIVDIKVTKVGTLWRKDPKKKKTRSPWQEWGAILTGAQLYFFRNVAWVKNLMHQYEMHLKQGHDGIPLIFKPPLEDFKPDALMSTDGAVALLDTTYKKHKNSFVYLRHGGLEEVLLADNEEDRNDWLAKLNYAAAFRTSGVRMRGVLGGNYDGQSRRAIRRLDSSDTTQLIQTPTGDVSINRSKIDHKMAQDILSARRDGINSKVADAAEKLQIAQKQLDTQLRNARHLLLLAPIQDRTRDQVRVGAAKMIAQLKWSRIEIWRLKCHRDILWMDLEDERDINGDLTESSLEDASAVDKPLLSHKGSRSSSHLTQQPSPRSPGQLVAARSAGSMKKQDGESPTSDVFQTPPTSATASSFRHASLGSSHNLGIKDISQRRASISSIASSAQAAQPIQAATPPGPITSPTSPPDDSSVDQRSEENAAERELLEQAGLLEADIITGPDSKTAPSTAGSEDTPDHQKRPSGAAADKDKLERSKIRRSLQRTLREGAGHLSHHRSKKGKDSASSGALADETIRDDVLTRGTGSFVVHGKKASVVNFGSELQQLSPDERIRRRISTQQTEDQGLTSPTGTDDDFYSIMGEAIERQDRRGSAASASTATARSFRELHRKYSTAQATKVAVSGSLAVPSDEDSDAAVSFSEGRRTPLPPVEDEPNEPHDDRSRPASQSRRSQFFTPEPPSSPPRTNGTNTPTQSGEQDKEAQRLSNPQLQAVGA